MTFTSIFPAAYAGRWPHVHFEVYPSLDDATTASGKLRTSQLALPEDASRLVYATDGYEQSVGNLAQTSLQTDMVFSDGYSLQLATVTGDVDLRHDRDAQRPGVRPPATCARTAAATSSGQFSGSHDPRRARRRGTDRSPAPPYVAPSPQLKNGSRLPTTYAVGTATRPAPWPADAGIDRYQPSAADIAPGSRIRAV